MRKLFFTLFVLSAVGVSAQGTWTQKANFAGQRTFASSLSIGTKGYVGLGEYPLTTPHNDWWEFDPSNNSWTQKANFAGAARGNAVAFSIGSKGYIGTGGVYSGGPYYNDFWEFDPIANSWTAKANFPGTARLLASGFSVGTKGYIGTGMASYTRLNDFWEWDQATNTWLQRANFSGAAREGAGGFSIGTKGYLACGSNGSVCYQDFWEYDPSGNSWNQKADVGGGVRAYPMAFSIGTKGYIGTGACSSYMADFWSWDQTNNTWTQVANYGGGARSSSTGFAIGNKGYGCLGGDGGSSSNMKQDIWELSICTPPTLTVSTTSVTVACGNNGSATVTPTGGTSPFTYSWNTNPVQTTDIATGLTAGNYVVTLTDATGCSATGSVSITQPLAQGTWTQKTSFSGSGRFWPLSFSIGVYGYISCGVNGSTSTYYKDLWEWNQSTNVWTQKADLPGVARSFPSGFSIGNYGYLGLGWDGGTYRNDFWQWNQSTNTWVQKASFPGAARYAATGFSVGSKGYVGLGLSAGWVYYKDFYEYDPSSDTWTQKNNFSTNRASVASFVIGSKGYIALGISGSTGNYTTYSDLWEWDPSSNSWTQKANFGGTARANASSFAANGKGYVGIGCDANTVAFYQDFWQWDPSTNMWCQVPNFGGGYRRQATGFSVGSMGYVSCGNSSGGAYLNDLWEFSTCTPPTFTVAQTNVTINGGANGSATVTPTGGATPFTYSWNTTPAQTTDIATGLSAGNYNVIVTDATGCSATSLVTITQPLGLSVAVSTVSVSCNGYNNGSALAIPSGGNPPYTYLWNTNATTQNITGLVAGSYSVLVTDGVSTMATKTVTIAEPAVLATQTFTIVNTACGTASGKITANLTGGTTPYSYFWGGGQTTKTISNLAPGGYTVTAVDAHGCSLVASATVTATEPNYSVSFNASPLTGDIPLSVTFNNTTPALANYNFTWYFGDGDNLSSNNSSVPHTYTVNGTHDVTLLATSIATGCTDTLKKPAYIIATGCMYTVTVTQSNVTVPGGSDGSATVATDGGTAPFTYSWNSNPVQANANATGLSAGNYTVTVTDGTGCTKTSSVTITQPPPLSVSATSVNVFCNGYNSGSAFAIPSGGNPPYTYLWNTSQTTQNISGLFAGSYSVLVTDAMSATATKTVIITQPAALAAQTFTVVNTNCGTSNGKITANITGGTLPHTYFWSNGSNNTLAISNLTPGSYTLTTVDAQGCVLMSSTAVNAIPLNYNLSFNANPQVGTVPLSVAFNNTTPNASNYNFAWHFGDGTSVNSNNPTVFHTYQFNGTYDVTLIANNIATGCSDTLTKSGFILATGGTGCTHTASVTPSGPVNACLGSGTMLSCNTDPSFTYQWNYNSASIGGATDSTYAATQSGYYSVTIFVNSCPVTSAAVQVNFATPPQAPLVFISGNLVACQGGNVTLSASTVAGCTYQWSPGGETTQAIAVNSADIYSVTVTNSAGCSATTIDTVSNGVINQSICMVTVDSTSSKNVIVWTKPVSLSIDSFRVYREIASVYKHIGSVAYSALSQFVDNTNGVNPKITAYKYKISALDTCGDESMLSSFHRTIHLSVSPASPCGYNLFWNDYVGLPISQYRVLRDSANTGWTAIDSVSFGTTSWTDINCYSGQDTIAYMLEIDHPGGCVVSIKNPEVMSSLNMSKSNVQKIVPTATSVGTNVQLPSITILPNPSSGLFTVKCDANITSLEVMNLLGETIYSSVNSNETKAEINLSDRNDGVYLLRVNSNKGSVVKKIVISK